MIEENPKSGDAKADLETDRPSKNEGEKSEEFLERLHGSFRWPKPDAESVAAATEAIHRMSGSAGPDLAGGESVKTCLACGGAVLATARFCSGCGVPMPSGFADATAHAGAGTHHIHHHYHHLVPGVVPGVIPGTPIPGFGVASAGTGTPVGASSAEAERVAPQGLAPGSPGISGGGRAEAGARKVVQDWVQACNNRHIDDLLELYAADATVIRSSVPPVRSLPAIREFLVSLLEAGLGDVEMESLRVEMLGEIAVDLGRCKMLVPVAMGKRREQRGKYLVVLVRQPVGNWKILADCWSADLAVNVPPPEPALRKGNEPVPSQRKPR